MAEIIFITHIIMMGICLEFTPKTEFLKSLNQKQKKAYYRIAKRRMLVYLYGGLFGALFSKFFVEGLCPQALTIIGVQMLYYLSYPWPEKMKDHLETQEQKNLWHNVSTHMNKRYGAALFIGAISAWIDE